MDCIVSSNVGLLQGFKLCSPTGLCHQEKEGCISWVSADARDVDAGGEWCYDHSGPRVGGWSEQTRRSHKEVQWERGQHEHSQRTNLHSTGTNTNSSLPSGETIIDITNGHTIMCLKPFIMRQYDLFFFSGRLNLIFPQRWLLTHTPPGSTWTPRRWWRLMLLLPPLKSTWERSSNVLLKLDSKWLKQVFSNYRSKYC